MTRRNWRELLRGETKHVEYKRAVAWDDEHKPAMVKDIIALSNIRDGGDLVIGVKENAATKQHEPESLSDEQLRSYDPTKVMQYVNNYVQPGVRLRIAREEIDGARIVVVEVEEFERAPNICARPGPGAKPEFFAGNILIRTDAAQSRVIQTAEEMRELLALAVSKTSETLLRDMKHVLEGRRAADESPAAPHADILEAWSKEREAFGARVAIAKGKEVVALFAFSIVPVGAVAPIADHGWIGALVNAATVRRLGYTHPSSDYEKRFNRAGFVEGVNEIEGYEHVWHAYSDGPVTYVEAIAENDVDFKTHGLRGDRYFVFSRACHKIGMSVVFAQRYLEQRAYDGDVVLDFLWTDMRGRKLVFNDPAIFDPTRFECREERINVSIRTTASELKAAWDSLALGVGEQVFPLFQVRDAVPALRQQLELLRTSR